VLERIIHGYLTRKWRCIGDASPANRIVDLIDWKKQITIRGKRIW